MTQNQQITAATVTGFGTGATSSAGVFAVPGSQTLQEQPLIAIMSLPDGSELLLRATDTGWTVTDNGRRSRPDPLAPRKSEIDLLHDIATAYALAPSRQVMALGMPRDRSGTAQRPN